MNDVDTQIKGFVEDLIANIREEMGNDVESVMLFGSYPIGRSSKAMPDINIAIFVRGGVSPVHYLKLGEAIAKVGKKYQDFNIYVDLRPFKYTRRASKHKQLKTIIVAPVLLDMNEKYHPEFPFGVSKYVLQGLKKTRKVVFGEDVLADVEVKVDRAYLLKNFLKDIHLYRYLLMQVPVSYNFTEDFDLFFHEVFIIGKILTYYGVELALTDDELKKGKNIDIITNKEKLIDFYKERYNSEAAQIIQKILEYREKYNMIKKTKTEAYNIFKLVFKLISILWQRIQDEIQKIRI
jgi:predicted nucleotidyltransferase